MELMTLDEFKNQGNEYQKFMQDNPATGLLKVEVFTAYKAVPIPETEILITKNFGDKVVVFFRGYTNSSGIIENIKLPAPIFEPVGTTFVEPQYTLYNLTAIHNKYGAIKEYNIGMFGDISIIQYIKMAPDISFEGVDTIGD